MNPNVFTISDTSNKFQAGRAEGTETVVGHAVRFYGFDEFEFFVYGAVYGWYVCEAKYGLSIGPSAASQAEAIESAYNILCEKGRKGIRKGHEEAEAMIRRKVIKSKLDRAFDSLTDEQVSRVAAILDEPDGEQ